MKNALVYGATGGIGQEMCRQLSSRGIRLFVLGRSPRRVKRLADQLNLPLSHRLCLDSITSEENYQRLVDWLQSQETTFQIGVHCIGYGCQKRAVDLDRNIIADLLNVNLISAFLFYKAFAQIKDEHRFDLVFFGSASVDRSWPKNSLYGASKAGLEYFAGSLQKEVQQEGGRVWLYKPGSVNTDFFDNLRSHLPPQKMIEARELSKIVVGNLEVAADIYFPSITCKTD